MARKLKDIDVEEISLVDAASNRKRFLIIKKELGEGAGVGGPRQGLGGVKYCVCPECGYSVEHAQIGEGKSKPCAQIECPKCGAKMAGSKTKELSKLKKAHISIDSDGTIKGTKILVDGEGLKNLADFSFSFYTSRSGEGLSEEPRVSCSYSKVTETEDGFKHTDHFYLSKGEVNNVDNELKELFRDYLGEDFSEEEFEKAEKLSDKVLNALKGAMNILNKYKGDFPDELKKAVAVLAKYAGYGYPAKKVEKAGAKLSKSTIEQIKKVIEALGKLIEPDKVKKEAGDENEEVKKELGEIKKALEKLEKKDEKGKKDELEDLKKRLETVEKAKGIKKSIDGDGGDGKDKDTKWPSFEFSEE